MEKYLIPKAVKDRLAQNAESAKTRRTFTDKFIEDVTNYTRNHGPGAAATKFGVAQPCATRWLDTFKKSGFKTYATVCKLFFRVQEEAGIGETRGNFFRRHQTCPKSGNATVH